MATSSKTQGADKKLTLNEAANKIAKEYPNIFTSPNESKLFEEDFKLLVRTYVMDGCMPGFEAIKNRRFIDITAYGRVKKYDSKAKTAGRPTLLERARTDAATRTQAEVDNTEEVMQMMKAHPEAMQQVMGETFGKLMKDLGEGKK